MAHQVIFRETTRFKGRVIHVTGAYYALGIITGGKIVFLVLLTSKYGKEVIWSTASLSIIN